MGVDQYDDLDDLVVRRWLAVVLDLDLLRLEQPVHGGFERLAAVLVLARELCCGVLPGEQRRRVAWTDLVADEALLLGVAARASFRPRANAPWTSLQQTMGRVTGMLENSPGYFFGG